MSKVKVIRGKQRSYPNIDFQNAPASGKTLLDDFAGQAMAALIPRAKVNKNDNDLDAAWIARDAYKIAVSMVAEKRRLEND